MIGASLQRILVAGCGAIGSVFGCFLRKAGHRVTLLGREPHLSAIRSAGLTLNGIWGSHASSGFQLADQAGKLTGPFDLILIAVKAYDTLAMVREVSLLLDPEGAAVSLQNGLGNLEILADHFGAERSLGASILVGAILPQPGRVTVTVQAAPIVIGALDLAPEKAFTKAKRIAATFQKAGIACDATDRILPHLWAKVLYNAPLNPLGALLEVHYGALGEETELREIMDRVIEEGFQVAVKKGVQLPWSSAEAYLQHFYSHLLPPTYDHRSSMLQDLQRGRPTEIRALNGKIAQYGRELGVPTPTNELMTLLISAKERTAKAREPSPHSGSGRDR